MARPTYAVSSLVLIVVLVVAVGLFVWRDTALRIGSGSSKNQPLVSQAALRALPHKSASAADTSHLGKGLIPPADMWLSGLALQKTPQAVYPLPLSFLAKDTGFEIGLPTVTSTPTEIAGEHVPGMTAQLDATGYKLTRYDKMSAMLTYSNGSRTLSKLILSEGSPFVFYTASTKNTLHLSGINPADVLAHEHHYVRYRSNGHIYAVSSPAAEVTVSTSGIDIALEPNDTVTLYGLPGSKDVLRPYAGNVIRSVSVSHRQQGNKVQTSFDYRTANGKPTVFAVPTYETVAGTHLAHYSSVYGQMAVIAGTRFTATVPTVTPDDELDLSKLAVNQKNQLRGLLAKDVAATKIDQHDSYYAGKQLARAANLLSIAEQLGQTNAANTLKHRLTQAFTERLKPGYFYYDTTLKGVAATTAAFGSQDFNDHHFHYGYWLYAGSIMAHYDHSFVGAYGDQLNLLAADIASYDPGSQFAVTRYYDPYAAHGWADGLAPFADGNDQESSSEAIHAWNGVALWGKITGNTALEQTGQWMLANENHTAAATWRSVDTSDPALRSYTSPVVGIAFGGKRTYSTWFSDKAAAKLAIQLIPMDPSMAISFASDKHIDQTIHASIQNADYNVPLGDYALMYLSLAKPPEAAQLLSKQTVIDDGDSATYLHAFVFTQLSS